MKFTLYKLFQKDIKVIKITYCFMDNETIKNK